VVCHVSLPSCVSDVKTLNRIFTRSSSLSLHLPYASPFCPIPLLVQTTVTDAHTHSHSELLAPSGALSSNASSRRTRIRLLKNSAHIHSNLYDQREQTQSTREERLKTLEDSPTNEVHNGREQTQSSRGGEKVLGKEVSQAA